MRFSRLTGGLWTPLPPLSGWLALFLIILNNFFPILCQFIKIVISGQLNAWARSIVDVQTSQSVQLSPFQHRPMNSSCGGLPGIFTLRFLFPVLRPGERERDFFFLQFVSSYNGTMLVSLLTLFGCFGEGENLTSVAPF